MRRLRYLIPIMFALVCLSGCATQLSQKAPSSKSLLEQSHPQLAKIEGTNPPVVLFVIDEPNILDAFEKEPYAKELVSVTSGGGDTLSNLLLLIQPQITPILVGNGLEDIQVGMLSFREISLLKLLRYIEARYDVAFDYNNKTQVLNIKKSLTRKIILPPIPGSRMGGIDGEVATENASLKELITTTASNLNVAITTMSDTTGFMHFSGAPSDVRELCSIIETEARERMKYVTLHVMFLELSVDNSFEKDFSLAAIPNMTSLGSDIFGTFRFSAPTTVSSGSGTELSSLVGVAESTATAAGLSVPSAANSLGLVLDKSNQISSLISVLEQWGTTEVVTAPAVMTSNGTPVSFDITEEIGYWEPGELDSTVNSDVGKSTTEGKPEFISEEVGLRLKILPKIITESKTGNPLIELDIALESSEVYGYAETTWQRSSDVAAITLSKPLKSKKLLSSRAILRPDEMLLLAKLDKKDNNDVRSGLPGVLDSSNVIAETISNRATNNTEKNLYIVINAILPVTGLTETSPVEEGK